MPGAGQPATGQVQGGETPFDRGSSRRRFLKAEVLETEVLETEVPQDARRSSPGLECVATNAGTTAMRLATTRTPATNMAMSQTGTTETGTAPKLLAKAVHTARPAMTPRGTPID